MENFNTTDLPRFSWLRKPYMYKKKYCQISFRQLGITGVICQTYSTENGRFTGTTTLPFQNIMPSDAK